MAQNLKRLLEQKGGVKVEVISAEDLLKDRAPEAPPPEPPPRRGGDASGVVPAPVRTMELAEGGGRARLGTFLLISAIGAQPDAQPAPAGPEQPSVTIAVDPVTNSLIVVGAPRMTDRLAALAAELERQMPAEPTKVRVVTLPETADAAALAQLVNTTAQRVGRATPENPGGFTGAVQVSPDPAGGALIVWANDTDFATVGQLIGAVAQVDAASSLTIKLYPLASVTAERAISAIEDLLSPQPRGAQARRIRAAIDVTLQGPGGEPVSGRVEPARVRLTSDPGGTSVIVAAPAEAIPLLDRFIGLIDQSPVQDRLAIRRYELTNAKADDAAQTLQRLFEAQRQGPAQNDLPKAQFVADDRTNSLLVTAAEPQHTDVQRLLASIDGELADPDLRLEIITLQSAAPSVVQKIVEEVVVGRDPAKRERVRISAQDDSSLFVVRAPAEQIEEIRAIVAQVDTAEVSGLPVRSLKLEHADAQTLAQSLQQFFQNRAQMSSRPGRRQVSRVAVVGDRRSGTLVIAASDEDYAQLQSLVSMFDAPSKAQQMQYRVIPLQNARVTDVQDTLENIASELQWERQGGFWFGGWGSNNESSTEEKLFVEVNERVNSVVVMGQGETMEVMLKIIAELDKPQAEQTRLIVRAVPVERADLDALANIVRQVTATPGWQSWRGRDPDRVEVQVDRARRMLMLIGKAPRVEQAVAYVNELAGAGDGAEHAIESIALQHAQADRAARALDQFFQDRARAEGLPEARVSIIGSADGNVLIVSAEARDMGIVRELVAQIDQPELGENRRIEVYALKNTRADDIGPALEAMFPRSTRPDDRVLVTRMATTNSILVSAPADKFEQVDALLSTLDAPPRAEDVRVTTVTLKTARAAEVETALRSALPAGVSVKITPITRNNTVLLTGSPEAIALAMEQIARIDEQPVVALEFKRIKLEHAIASEAMFTLRQLLRSRPKAGNDPDPGIDYNPADNTIWFSGTADQLRDIERMVQALDVPSADTTRTEFVRLEFAKAEQVAEALKVFYGQFAPAAKTPGARSVTIVPDPASNSLVISADESEWEGVRNLLRTLDNEKYDTSRQLAVIPLRHADAPSVARAINDGFRAPIEDQLRQQQLQRQGRGQGQNPPQNQGRPDEGATAPTLLVTGEELPTVSAEVQTNSLIVFAGRQDMERIRAIVQQIDVPDFAKFPDAQVIPLTTGRASEIANSVRALFATQTGRGAASPRSVVIVGDDASNCLIVRAEERELAQIRALAETLQQQADRSGVAVRVLAIRNIPAARLQKTIATTFAPLAREHDETLAVEVDRAGNALVVASSERVYREIEQLAGELDVALPREVAPNAALGAGGLGLGVFIIDVKNNSPEDVRKMLEGMGLTRPQPDDRPGVVSEPVTIVPLTSRQAIAVVAGAADGEAVVALVRALDSEPQAAEQQVRVVALKVADATPVVATLKGMLAATADAGGTTQAKAIAEQIRRLNLVRNGIDQEDLALDLSQPIRLIADTQTNSVVVASTRPNVDALVEIVTTLDALPIGDAVVVRFFPLDNASATRVKGVVDDLFKQGEALRRLPGTERRGLPSTATGQALAGEIAVTVDDRTNTLIVAGREDAVAFVEVMVKNLDAADGAKWVEPRLIPLKFADAVRLAATLREVLVQGLVNTPETEALRRQISRLRIASSGRPAVESDIFVPLSGLVISAEESLNALIVVGTTANIDAVAELAAMLDVEGAGAASTVRVFPLEHAAADRVAAMVREVFQQREQAAGPNTLRPEDRVVITADARTNTLVVSTSPRSFSILEAILRTLDSAESRPTVAIHVVPVPGADAAALAPKIDRLMRERINAAQQSGAVRSPLDVFSVEADPANDLLIVACSDENLAMVREVVSALTSTVAQNGGAARNDIIPLRSGRAADVAQTVQSLYVDRENERRGKDSVTVAPNDRLNALIVSGTEADVSAIRALVDRFESAPVTTVQEIRRIELRSANALELVSLLQNVLSGRGLGAPNRPAGQAIKLKLFVEKVADDLAAAQGVKPTEAEVDTAIRELVTLTPDLRTNSVLVAAPADMMALIAELITDLDTTKRDRRIEQYQLLNADARAMAELLRDVFNLRQQGNLYVLVPTEPSDPSREPLPGAEVGGTTVTPVPDERQALSIAIDVRTNTLIVSGTEEYLTLVSGLVKDLDGIKADERESIVYELKNSNAKDIEATLRSSFQGESALQRELLGGELAGSTQRRLEQEITVVGDEKSNKLIVTVAPRYTQKVIDIIRELDAAPPQVMIQVLLAEVTVDQSETWGADFKLKNFGGDAYNFTSLAAGAGVAAALGVPNLSFSSVDFELMIRALEAQGKLQILSKPYVTARNNVLASIQVGDNIAIVQNTERTPQGGTVADVTREDLGIQLNVTPSVSTDGFVRMEITPEISTLTNRTTQITEDFVAPVIAKRTLTTTVTVKDGQTVVIGGLIQAIQEARKSEVPLVGKVPGLGWLFRAEERKDTKTELVIILTPTVIYNDSPGAIEHIGRITDRKIGTMQDPGLIRDALRDFQPEPESPVPGPVEPPIDDPPASPPSPAQPPREPRR